MMILESDYFFGPPVFFSLFVSNPRPLQTSAYIKYFNLWPRMI